MAPKTVDAWLAMGALRSTCTENPYWEAKPLSAEFTAAEGKHADIGGYYLPDAEKAGVVMRPSKTFNEALAAL